MGNSGNAVPADNHPTATAISVEPSAQLQEKVAGADGAVFFFRLRRIMDSKLDPTSEMEEKRFFLFFSSNLFFERKNMR
ncbi:hypothetical protein SLA2020_527480 [Shorea laevis]